MNGRRAWLLAALCLSCGCISHDITTAPIEFKPIHITMDINLRVQRELNDFFDFEDDVPVAGDDTAPKESAATRQGGER